MDNSIFPAEFYDLSNPINSTTLPASSVLELGYINLPFLVIYKYYFDYSTGFLGPTGVMVPVVFVEEDIGCILPEQMDLDFGLVCNYDEYCGQTYIDVDKVDIVLADFVEGTPFEDGTYKVTIQDFGVDWFSGALVPGWSGGVALYSMADTLLPFNGSNDTIFSGFLNLSIDESLLSYGFSCSGDVGYNSFVQITITDANGFSIQTLVQTIVTDGSSIWNLPPCASPSEMPYGLFTAVPDTIYVCGNEVLNNDEICAQAPCSGGGWPDGIIYALFLDSAPPSYSLYDDEPENFIDESFSLATLLNENADGPTEDYRVGIYYKLLSYPGGSENTVNVPVVFLDNEDQNCSFLDADIEIVCHTQDYCGQEYWDQGTVDIYINEVVGGIPFENGGYSIFVEFVDVYNPIFSANFIDFSANDSILNINSDTIYWTDSFIPSETEPVLSYSFESCSDVIIGDLSIGITITDSIGNTTSSILQIIQELPFSSSGLPQAPCPELIPSSQIVYSYSDPLSLCPYGGSSGDICAFGYCLSLGYPSSIVYALFDGMVPDYFEGGFTWDGIPCTNTAENMIDNASSFDELSLEGFEFTGQELFLGLYNKPTWGCSHYLSSESIPVSVSGADGGLLEVLPLETLCYPNQNYVILENGDTFYVEGVGSYQTEFIVEQTGECNVKIVTPIEVVQTPEETVLPVLESCTQTIELTDTTLILESGETLTYSQIFSNQYGCDSLVSQVISFSELPVLSINEGLDTIIGPPSGVSLNAVGEFDSFAWSNGVETAETMVNESGLYTVTAITEAGCSQTSEVYVALDLVGLDEPDWAASIRLSPNPTKDVFFLSNVPSEVTEINIYAQSGQLVKRVLPETNKIEINGLMAGVYSVEFVGKRLSVFEQLVVLP